MHTTDCGRTGIILVRPRYPENIGASARIAHNFGITELIVVSDAMFDEERMLKMATHKAAHLIEEMKICRTTAEAAQPFHILVGATARQGRHRLREQTPREVMTELAPLQASQRIGLMFGPESTGLANEDLDLCQFASTIPTAGFASLNLAQAVAIHCYEFHSICTSRACVAAPSADLANSFDLEGMYAHIEEALTTITFLHDTNRIYWMRNVRQFLGRMRLTKKEASMIRGICRKLLWHNHQVNGKILNP
ncbi:RNA methyltransferase [Desulfobulbus alkaliphilus]|uniref:RNA methyltransferase n=1 Tax=Desulfobulbus alkaliphilus TaxID=869814 RepID=UPI001F06114A|nr:TrmH family RNA methyltransferase [Desulfobulbus alkaliphilus]